MLVPFNMFSFVGILGFLSITEAFPYTCFLAPCVGVVLSLGQVFSVRSRFKVGLFAVTRAVQPIVPPFEDQLAALINQPKSQVA